MAKSDPMMLNISRVDRAMRGYYVRVGLSRGQKPKFFSDSSYGGKPGALKAAKAHRDKIVEQLNLGTDGKGIAGRVANRRTVSGVTGVHLTRGRLEDELYWRAKVHRKLDRTFSVKKYGYIKAFQLAVQAKYSALGEAPPRIKPPTLTTLLAHLSKYD